MPIPHSLNRWRNLILKYFQGEIVREHNRFIDVGFWWIDEIYQVFLAGKISAAKCINVGGRETDENGNCFYYYRTRNLNNFQNEIEEREIITSSDKELVVYDMIVIFM